MDYTSSTYGFVLTLGRGIKIPGLSVLASITFAYFWVSIVWPRTAPTQFPVQSQPNFYTSMHSRWEILDDGFSKILHLC